MILVQIQSPISAVFQIVQFAGDQQTGLIRGYRELSMSTTNMGIPVIVFHS